MRCIKVLVVLLLMPSLTWADAVMTPAAGPAYPAELVCDYRTSICLKDEFLSGGTASGSIGELGWQFSNGSLSQLASEANRFGLIRRDTSASSGTVASLHLYASATGINPALAHLVHFEARLNTNDANTTVRLGERDSASANPPTNGIYLEKLDADTNWFCVTRASSTQTRTDSGVAVDTAFHTVKLTRSGGGVQFSLDGVNICGAMTTNIPTAFVFPSVQIVNSAAASKTIDVDYFALRLDGVVR